MDAVERLRELGVFLNTVVDDAAVFRECGTVAELSQRMRTTKLPMNGPQYLFFYVPKLAQAKPEILDEAERKLGHLGIASPVVREYFQSGHAPGFALMANHGEEYPWAIRGPFSEAADQFGLDKMREYLGYQR